MKHTITNSLAALLLLATGLTACSKQEAEGDRLPQGEHPVKLIAAMQEQTHSRATADNTWNGTEEIAVQIGNEVKKHMADADGALNLGQGVSPWYWQSTTEKKSVSAWHSHTYQATRPASFTVQEDQSGDGYQQSDMIYAHQEITLADQTLLFKHLPAKMVVNLKAGEGIAPDEVQGATLTIVNQATRSEAIADDWSVAQATKGSTPIVPKSIIPAASGCLMSTQALLVPQQMQGKRFIKVTIGADAAKRDFYYTPTGEGDANLTAGKLHTLNLVVKSSGLEFSSITVEQWDDTETGEGEVKPLPPAQIGDFYMNDGTWLPKSTELTDKQKAACIGIVFKVGRDLDGDWKDDCQYRLKNGTTEMNTIQGYVLALYDTNDGKECTWGFYGTEVGTQTAAATGFDGYKNTNTIKEYATNNSKVLQTDFPATYYATNGYEATCPAPDNTSGWFLLSVGQCQYWLDNEGVLLKSVQKATGTAESNWADSYWSSSEYYYYPAVNAWFLYFGYGNVYNDFKSNYHYVRSVLAF